MLQTKLFRVSMDGKNIEIYLVTTENYVISNLQLYHYKSEKKLDITSFLKLDTNIEVLSIDKDMIDMGNEYNMYYYSARITYIGEGEEEPINGIKPSSRTYEGACSDITNINLYLVDYIKKLNMSDIRKSEYINLLKINLLRQQHIEFMRMGMIGKYSEAEKSFDLLQEEVRKVRGILRELDGPIYRD